MHGKIVGGVDEHIPSHSSRRYIHELNIPYNKTCKHISTCVEIKLSGSAHNPE